ncbi:dihydrodipicolinate synthase family protein [Sinomonas sp. JGH33]|uniref:Dihydrodipicolinate synthase family protein n=1 Tax=Sinomonas terricola TaxID=3110330 RepID=A0ABU5TC69_9MICC|nr:dihydrodipicolinate synthase family protein [Sinomonas sp. JGH33]MEA5457276.1 dihydrodipicolinate synthase family protein [Sinomonas sp. JGH33]
MVGIKVGWTGVYPAALTHFTPGGEVDYDMTAEHIDWLVGQGAHGLIVGGTSGEFVGMDLAEHRRLIDTAVSAVAGRVPVIVGSGRYSTAESVSLTEHAQQAGADGVLVVQPYFQRPNRLEVLTHYRAVGNVGMPLMVYNIPANSAADPVSVSDLALLHAEGVAHAVKSTLPTVNQIHEIRMATDDSFRVFYGGISSPLEGLAGGAHAWVSGVLNVIVPEAVRLWDAMAASDLAAARAAWQPIARVAGLVSQFRGEAGDLAVYRALLGIMGRPSGASRAPLLGLTPDQAKRLESALAAA